MSIPWLFHIPDPALAAEIAPELYALGALIIADPEHMPEDMRTEYLFTVTHEGADEVRVHVHACDWSFPLERVKGEPDNTAANVYTLAESPTSIWSEAEELPEETPERVIEWFEF